MLDNRHVTPKDTAGTAIDAAIAMAYHVGQIGDPERRAVGREHLTALVHLANVDDGVKREMLAQIDAVLRSMAVTRELAATAPDRMNRGALVTYRGTLWRVVAPAGENAVYLHPGTTMMFENDKCELADRSALTPAEV